jgi:hypothetical protein
MEVFDEQYITDVQAFKQRHPIMLEKDEKRVEAYGEIHRNDFMIADIDNREERIEAMPEWSEIRRNRDIRVAKVLEQAGFTVLI